MMHRRRGRDLRLATGWTFRRSNPGGGEIFSTRSDRPWGPPSLLHNGYRVCFLGVKRPGNGVNHPPPSSAEVKEKVELFLDSPFGPSRPVLGWTSPLWCIEVKVKTMKTVYSRNSAFCTGRSIESRSQTNGKFKKALHFLMYLPHVRAGAGNYLQLSYMPDTWWTDY